MDGIEKPDFLQYLVDNIRCTTCGGKFYPEDFRVLGRREEIWFVAVSCGHCATQGIIFALVREGETAPRVKATGELTAEEQTKFSSLPPISMDEVTDIHRLLRDFQGDVHELFKE